MAASEKNKSVWKVFLITLFLIVAACATILILLSEQCGGGRQIKQAQLELPVTTSTTTTTTTAITTTTTTTVTTTFIDYEMKLDITYVEEYDSVNSDVVGWVYVEDTPIDYPVVQGEDNGHYIHLDWKGNNSFAGCIFEDYRSNIDKNNLIMLYGHNMGDGSMFHGVKYYLDEEWGKEHPYFELASEDKRYLYEVVSVNVVYGGEGADFGYWLPNQEGTMKLGKDDFDEYVEQMKSTANVWYLDEDVVPEYGDRLIGLQTCYSGNDDGMRCVLFGRCLGER